MNYLNKKRYFGILLFLLYSYFNYCYSNIPQGVLVIMDIYRKPLKGVEVIISETSMNNDGAIIMRQETDQKGIIKLVKFQSRVQVIAKKQGYRERFMILDQHAYSLGNKKIIIMPPDKYGLLCEGDLINPEKFEIKRKTPERGSGLNIGPIPAYYDGSYFVQNNPSIIKSSKEKISFYLLPKLNLELGGNPFSGGNRIYVFRVQPGGLFTTYSNGISVEPAIEYSQEIILDEEDAKNSGFIKQKVKVTKIELKAIEGEFVVFSGTGNALDKELHPDNNIGICHFMVHSGKYPQNPTKNKLSGIDNQKLIRTELSGKTAHSISINNIVVNPNGTLGEKYLTTNLKITASSEAIKTELEEKRAGQLQGIINSYLSSKRLDELSVKNAEVPAAEELKLKINKEVGQNSVTNIKFSKFSILESPAYDIKILYVSSYFNLENLNKEHKITRILSSETTHKTEGIISDNPPLINQKPTQSAEDVSSVKNSDEITSIEKPALNSYKGREDEITVLGSQGRGTRIIISYTNLPLSTIDFSDVHVSDWELHRVSGNEGRVLLPLSDANAKEGHTLNIGAEFLNPSRPYRMVLDLDLRFGSLFYFQFMGGLKFKHDLSDIFSIGILPQIGAGIAICNYGEAKVLPGTIPPIHTPVGTFYEGYNLSSSAYCFVSRIMLCTDIKISDFFGFNIQAGYNFAFLNNFDITASDPNKDETGTQDFTIDFGNSAVVKPVIDSRTGEWSTEPAGINPKVKMNGLIFKIGFTFTQF
jgi:flagellar basal body-associated protein FliL